MALLERASHLHALATALQAAIAAEGRIAVVSGEAGIGKTSFVDRFLATRCPAIRILKGIATRCSTPRRSVRSTT
jgi:hypothetical protein